MKVIEYEYHMQLAFSEPASRHHFTLKCFPSTDEVQVIRDQKFLLSPSCQYTQSFDPLGNAIVYGCVCEPHSLFEVRVRGRAEIEGKAKRTADPARLTGYCFPTALTKADNAILAYAASLGITEKTSPFQASLLLQEALYRDMRYVPGATWTETPPAEAFAKRSGVCQDYSQIMIAALRAFHIPCRYVVGLIPGEGASHAWVETAVDGQWVGFDPTNGRMADDTYLVISHGYGKKSCRINTGLFCGGGLQTMTVFASSAEK